MIEKIQKYIKPLSAISSDQFISISFLIMIYSIYNYWELLGLFIISIINLFLDTTSMNKNISYTISIVSVFLVLTLLTICFI